MASRQLLMEMAKLIPDQDGFSFRIHKAELARNLENIEFPHVHVYRKGSKGPYAKIWLVDVAVANKPKEFSDSDIRKIISIIKTGDNRDEMIKEYFKIVSEIAISSSGEVTRNREKNQKVSARPNRRKNTDARRGGEPLTDGYDRWWEIDDLPDDFVPDLYIEGVEFDDSAVYVILSDGDEVELPYDGTLPELKPATVEQREDFWLSYSTVDGCYDGIHWDDFDLDIGMKFIMYGL